MTEVLLLIVPALLSITTFAERPGWLSIFILLPTGLLLCWPLRESGTPLPSRQPPPCPPPPVHGENTSPAQQPQIPPLPALTTYRAYMLVLTYLSILAVDFPIFPRSLAKCETYGVSLVCDALYSCDDQGVDVVLDGSGRGFFCVLTRRRIVHPTSERQGIPHFICTGQVSSCLSEVASTLDPGIGEGLVGKRH